MLCLLSGGIDSALTAALAGVDAAYIAHSADEVLVNSGRFSGLLLKGAGSRQEGFTTAPSRPALVGRDGTAITDLRPSGTARIGEERVDVITEGEYVPQGSRVEVVRSEGYRHVVRKVS